MAAGAEHEGGVAAEELAHQVGAGPGHDVVFAGSHQVGRDIDLAEINLDAEHLELARDAQVVLEVHVAQVPGDEGAGDVGAVGVPVQHVEHILGSVDKSKIPADLEVTKLDLQKLFIQLTNA